MPNPPHKLDIECFMICMLILKPDLLKTVPVKKEHFYHGNNEKAITVLLDMQANGEAIDITTFGARFYDLGGSISELRPLFGDYIETKPRLAETYLKILAEETAKRKIWRTYQSLSDAPVDFINEMKKIELDFIEQKPKTVDELSAEYFENYQTRKQEINQAGSCGVVTGFNFIDKLSPFDDGNLIVLAAKTSVGKTALALNIAVNAAMFNQNVLFFSAEMTTGELMNRVFAQLSGIDSTRFKYRNVDLSIDAIKTEIAACGKNLKLIEAGRMTSEDICRMARREALNFPPRLIVVDYIQYLKDRIGKGNTNNDRIGGITQNLKSLALELKCPVLALSQVNRAAIGEPTLANLRDSGNIEQDSDIVLILHREFRDDVVGNVNIAKGRNGATSEKNQIRFNAKLTKYYE